jgi:hypothetical protein
MPEELTTLRGELRKIAGRERRERRSVGIDLIAEDPKMSTGKAPLFAAFQTQLADAAVIGAGFG